MSNRENLFRPVHKGIRSMIYELGDRLQTTDFANVMESNAIATQLKHDLSDTVSNCLLCLLHAHSKHEERDIFSAVRPLDPDVIDLQMVEHGEVVRRIFGVTKTCDELLGLTDRARRIEVGDRLNLEANELFAFYLAHLNNEEATVVPVMWEHFTDEQLRAMRAKFYASVPLPRFEEWMRWTLPALNLNELLVLLSGMKNDPPPSRFADVVRLAERTLDPERWTAVKTRLDLSTP